MAHDAPWLLPDELAGSETSSLEVGNQSFLVDPSDTLEVQTTDAVIASFSRKVKYIRSKTYNATEAYPHFATDPILSQVKDEEDTKGRPVKITRNGQSLDLKGIEPWTKADKRRMEKETEEKRRKEERKQEEIDEKNKGETRITSDDRQTDKEMDTTGRLMIKQINFEKKNSKRMSDSSKQRIITWVTNGLLLSAVLLLVSGKIIPEGKLTFDNGRGVLFGVLGIFRFVEYLYDLGKSPSRCLKKLKKMYKNSTFEGISEIKIDDDDKFIEIAGNKICLKTESIAHKKRKDVLKLEENYFFTYDSATDRFGDKLPSKEQWEKIIDAIPGKHDGTHTKNVRDLLSIGVFCQSVIFDLKKQGDVVLWTSSSSSDTTAFCIYLPANDDKIEFWSMNKSQFLPVRVFL